MNTNTTNATSSPFDFNQKFDSQEAAQAAAATADLSNFRITRVMEGEWLIIDASTKAATKAASAEPAKGKAKGKAKGGRPSAAKRAAKAGDAIAKGDADRKAAKDLAKAKADKAASPDAAKDMHYSAETLPSKETIESGLKGMQPAMRAHFAATLEGKLPDYDVFKLSRKEKDKDGKEKMESELTHLPFRGRRDELYTIRNKGKRDAEAALKEALAWRGGKGTRMTCSSTIPLGRFHHQLILALKAKLAGKRKEARQAAKNGNGAAPAAPALEAPQA